VLNEQAVLTLRDVIERMRSNTGDPNDREVAQIIMAKDRVRDRYAPYSLQSTSITLALRRSVVFFSSRTINTGAIYSDRVAG